MRFGMCAAVSAIAARTLPEPWAISVSNCCSVIRSRSHVVTFWRATMLETCSKVGAVSASLKCAVTFGNHCFQPAWRTKRTRLAPRR